MPKKNPKDPKLPRRILRMDMQLRSYDPIKADDIYNEHRKTYEYLEQKLDYRKGIDVDSPIYDDVQDLFIDLSSAMPKGNPEKMVKISPNVGNLLLDYVDTNNRAVTSLEIVAVNSMERKSLPLSILVKAKAEIDDLIDRQVDQAAIEELEGFSDSFEYLIQKSRRQKNPDDRIKRMRQSKAKKAAKKSSKRDSAVREVRGKRVKSVLAKLNPSGFELKDDGIDDGIHWRHYSDGDIDIVVSSLKESNSYYIEILVGDRVFEGFEMLVPSDLKTNEQILDYAYRDAKNIVKDERDEIARMFASEFASKQMAKRTKNPKSKINVHPYLKECRKQWELYCDTGNKRTLTSFYKRAKKGLKHKDAEVRKECRRGFASARKELRDLGMKEPK